jgi:phosphomannomutase
MELYRSKDLDIEECLALGRALGTVYGHDAILLTARDGVHISRLAKRAVVIGIACAGCSVLDLRLAPEVLIRFNLERGNGDAGVYVTYAGEGLRVNLLSKDEEGRARGVKEFLSSRKFPDVPLGSLGGINMYPNAVDDYIRADHKRVHFLRDLKVLVDCRNSSISVLVLPLLEIYGMKVALFNDSLTTYQEPQGKEAFLRRFRGGEFAFGVRILPDNVELLDREGRVEDFESLEALLKQLAREAPKG